MEKSGHTPATSPKPLFFPFKNALPQLKQKLAQEQAEQARKTEAQKLPPERPKVPAQTPDSLADDDATALSLAMQGVTPLSDERPSRVSVLGKTPSRTREAAPFRDDAEADARARLAALVAQDIPFRVESDAGFVRGIRSGAPQRVLRELGARQRASETLDLHGLSQREARQAVEGFVRRVHREGLSVVCIVHGKGHHSEDGVGVLQQAVVSALTETAAASQVLAFVTAPAALGGSGALLVELFHGRRR